MLEQRRDGTISWLTLHRPERLNAFTAHGYRALRTALQRLVGDDTTRIVVLTGHGRAFSVGADRSLLDGAASAGERQQAGEEFLGLLEVLRTFDKPLFAAVNGLAVGFGATLLLYCDVVLLAETARLRLPFTALGIVPEAGSSALLPTQGRWTDAMWAVLSSEWMDAATAVQTGLALRVVPDSELLLQIRQAAAAVAAHDPRAVAATKRLMVSGRTAAAQLAIERELDEMRILHPIPGPEPPEGTL